MKTQEEKKLFYAKCAEILDIENEYNTPVPRRTRWNNRNIGNGRYPGFGLVQCFGNTTRVISKNGTRMFGSYEAVYEYLHTVVDKPSESVYNYYIRFEKEKYDEHCFCKI